MNGRRKVFVAINIDNRTKKYIDEKINKIGRPVGFIKRIDPENYHITLLYIGFVSDEETAKICNQIKIALKSEREFDFLLNSFFWGPKENNPKMLWVIGEKSEKLINLKYAVDKAIDNSGNKIRKKEFKPHINLGRIIKKLVDSNNKFTKIKEKININIPVSSVEVMESLEENGKSRHYVLESVELS